MATAVVNIMDSCVIVAGLLLMVSVGTMANQDAQCPKGPAQSYLWRVRDFPPAYVFGTVHVSNDAVWPHVPGNVKTAWRDSDAVFAELDWSDSQTQEEVRRCRQLPEGQTIDGVLPPDVFERLKLFMRHVRNALPEWVQNSDHLSSFLINWKMQKKQLFKTYVGDWRRKRPIWALLLVNDLTREKVEGSGSTVLDENLLNVARTRGQVTGALETASEQCNPLNRLNQSVVIQALNKTLEIRLREHSTANAPTRAPGVMSDTDALIQAYNCGQFDNKKFLRKLMGKKKKRQAMESALLKEFDYLVESSLVIGRNRDMANTVSRLLRLHKGKTLFFAMGVAHLVGNSTVLTNLKAMGHSVEPMARTEAINQRPKLEATMNDLQAPPRIQGSSHATQSAQSPSGKKGPWKPTFVAVENDWASMFTDRLNKIVKTSTRKSPPSTPLNAIPIRKSERANTATPVAVEVYWSSGTSSSTTSKPYFALLLYMTIVLYLA
eukprot:scpid53920/ scgid7927/ UPF0632 protein A